MGNGHEEAALVAQAAAVWRGSGAHCCRWVSRRLVLTCAHALAIVSSVYGLAVCSQSSPAMLNVCNRRQLDLKRFVDILLSMEYFEWQQMRHWHLCSLADAVVGSSTAIHLTCYQAAAY